MDARSKAWFQVNHSTLCDANSRVDELLDELITAGVFATTADDYQEIEVQDTQLGKMRKLLDKLQWKKPEALDILKKAIGKLCPHILERCVVPKPPKSRMHQLRDLLTATYQTRKFSLMPAMPWVGAEGEVQVGNFFRDLMVIDRHELAKSMADRASTTTGEQARRADRYARGQGEQRTSCISTNLFTQRRRSRDELLRQVQLASSATALSQVSDGAGVATGRDGSSDVVVTVGQDAHRCGMSLCTHRNVAVWAGAGCGKTGLCFNVAHLHSCEQLWDFFDVVLLLRLRDPVTQKAKSLAQLLRALLPDTSLKEVQEFAKELLRRNGEGVLALLDGVDELVEREGSFVVRQLKGEVLSEACLLATSRPCRAAKKFFETSVFPANVELLGFSEGQVEAFINEHLDCAVGEKLKKVLDGNPGVASLMSVPLLALLVCQVFKDVPDVSLSTKTKLYSALVVLVLRHAVSEKRVRVAELEEERLCAVTDVDKLPTGKAKNLLMELAKIACTAHDQDKAIFDVEFLMEEAKCKSLDVVKLGLLDIDEMKDGLSNIKLYSFRHLTFQEFLTALFLADKISKKPDELEKTLKDLCKDAHSHVVLQFLAGLLEKEHHSVFFSLLNQWLHHPHRDDCSVGNNDGVDENRGDGRYPAEDDSGDGDDNGAGDNDGGCHGDDNHSVGITTGEDYSVATDDDNNGGLVLVGGSSDDHAGVGGSDGDDSHGNVGDHADNSDEEEDNGDDNDDDDDDDDKDDDGDDGDGSDDDDSDDDDSDDDDGKQERLRVCLLCAQEACGGDVDSFPDQLKLPKTVYLLHVTATDLTILTAAVKNSSTINDLRLDFDKVREESDSASVSRVKRQTRSAMTSLTTAVSKHPSLRRVRVFGPTYSLFEGKSLANLVVSNRLHTLRVWYCVIGDTEVSEFSSELQHTTLTWLDLRDNMISDAGMYALADALQHNRTVQWLWLYGNRHSEEAASRLRQQLAHIKDLLV